MQIMGFLLVVLVVVSESLSARVLMDNPTGFGDEAPALPVPPLPLNSGNSIQGSAGSGDLIYPGYGMDNGNGDSLLDSTPLWTPILLRKIIQQIHRQQQQLQQQQQPQYPSNKRSKNFYQQCAFNAVSCFG